MRILGLITARGGSKGIPGKNIKPLHGKALINYTIEAALESGRLDRIVLSSDSNEIIEHSRALRIEAPFIRPIELAEDTTTSIEVIKHALEYFEDKGEQYDAVCLLQPTTPFRRKNLIDECIHKFIDGNFDSLISVRKIPDEYNPHWAFEDKNGTLRIATGEKDPISRRQDLPKAFHRDGAIYLTRTEVIKAKSSLLGENIGFMDTTEDPYVNIDTPSDWIKAEQLAKK
jgi:CMP-N,N'-diacetyllegionaminic acid synthase